MGDVRQFYDQQCELMEELFDNQSIAALRLQPGPLLGLYAQGCTSGTVVSVGHGVSTVSPVIEGQVRMDAVRNLPLAGDAVTDRLSVLLASELGLRLSGSSATEVMRTLKEQCSYVAVDYDSELTRWQEEEPPARLLPNDYKQSQSGGTDGQQAKEERVYTLPDGRMIDPGHAAFSCAEVLFQPVLANDPSRGVLGLHAATHMAVKDCDPDIQDLLYSNVLVTGGTTLTPQLPLRMQVKHSACWWFVCTIAYAVGIDLPCASPCTQNELSALDARAEVHVFADDYCQPAEWIGGCVVAALWAAGAGGPAGFVTAQEWQEEGPSVTMRKFDCLS